MMLHDVTLITYDYIASSIVYCHRVPFTFFTSLKSWAHFPRSFKRPQKPQATKKQAERVEVGMIFVAWFW